MKFQKVTIVGVGLLGGSLGLAIKKRKLARQVVGYVRRKASIAECKRFRAVDLATTDLRKAVSGADFVVLCTPIGRMRELVEEMLPSLKRGVLVTDVGSVKTCVVRKLESLVEDAGGHFVGSHPMAGAEKIGVSAAGADLFVNSVCAVTLTKKNNRSAARRIEGFWKAVGAKPVRLSAELHDVLVSRSSHLPHVIAAELANYVLSPTHPDKQPLFCANGFRDSTRIASGSPEMWRDIAIANRKNISHTLEAFIRDLQQFQRALKKGDQNGIQKFFESAKRRRDDLI